MNLPSYLLPVNFIGNGMIGSSFPAYLNNYILFYSEKYLFNNFTTVNIMPEKSLLVVPSFFSLMYLLESRHADYIYQP